MDAAVSRFLRRGMPSTAGVGEAGATSDTPERWQLPNRLKGRLGYLGVFYKRDPLSSCAISRRKSVGSCCVRSSAAIAMC